MRTEVFERPLPLPPPLLLSPSVRRSPEVRGAGTPPVAPRPPFGRDTPPPCCNPFLSRGKFLSAIFLLLPGDILGGGSCGLQKRPLSLRRRGGGRKGRRGNFPLTTTLFPRLFFPKKEKKEEEERKECARVWWPPKPPLFFSSLFLQGEKSAKVKKKREGRENPILRCHLSSPLSKAGKCRRRIRCKQVIRKPPSKVKGERGSEVSSKTGFFFAQQ